MVNRVLFLFLSIFIQLQAVNILQEASINNNRLVLKFKRHVKNKSISLLKKRDYVKYVFNFKNTKPKHTLINKKFRCRYPLLSIKISKPKKNLTRVVIKSKKVYKPVNYWLSNSFVIKLPKPTNPPKKNMGKVIKNLFSSINKKPTTKKRKRVSKKNPLIIPTKKRRYRVVIDAGHGGKDVGALDPSKKYKEKNAVLAIALKLRRHLKRMGFTVFMTREKDKFIKLGERSRFANSHNADIFISIHANSIEGSKRILEKTKGIETYYLSPAKSDKARMVAEKENSVEFEKKYKEGMNAFLKSLTHSKIVLSHKLAIDIQRNIISKLRKKYRGIVNGGVKPAPFKVLVGAEMPAVLIETGFISNTVERRRLFYSPYQDRLAKGIALGVSRFLANREREIE